MLIQERIETVQLLLAEVKNHCMCSEIRDDGAHYTVFYPFGDWPVDGVRITQSMGKAKALTKLLEYMESHWKASQL